MDGTQFDDLLRLLTHSRRSLATGVLVAVTGFLPGPGVEARKKRKRKNRKVKKAKPNEFGCLEVGDPCTSEDQCCSGICAGKKGKRTCRAHDTGTCIQAGRGLCTAQNPFALGCNNGATCFCLHTTAGSNFCADYLSGPLAEQCADCATDADCEALGFPLGSACVQTAEGGCSGVCDTGTACLAPCPETSE